MLGPSSPRGPLPRLHQSRPHPGGESNPKERENQEKGKEAERKRKKRTNKKRKPPRSWKVRG